MPTEEPDSDDSLVEAMMSVGRRVRMSALASLSDWDVTPSQMRALRVFMKHGGMRLSELADHLRIAARSTTEVVDGLADRGLVERSPDPTDRRATLVDLTDRGRALATEIRTARGAEAERIFDVLSPADRAHLARILKQLRD